MPSKPKTALTDEDNVQMRVVDDGETLTVEEAYKLLADMPPPPVDVPKEE